MTADDQEQFRALTAELVASYVSHNSISLNDLPSLIASTYESLSRLMEEKKAEPEKLTPPVSIRKSINPEFLISMEDGRRYRSLKRHLATRGLTPDQYRRKWRLPADYPMVAPEYAQRRSELAKANGLGRKRVVAAPPLKRRSGGKAH